MLDKDDIARLRRLMELKEDAAVKEQAAKDAKTAYKEAELELFEILDEGPVSRLNNVDLGEPWGKVSFGRRETYYGRVIPGKEDEAQEYYEQRGMVDEIYTPKPTMRRINDEVRERIEGGLPMPPGIDFYANRGVTITQQKK